MAKVGKKAQTSAIDDWGADALSRDAGKYLDSVKDHPHYDRIIFQLRSKGYNNVEITQMLKYAIANGAENYSSNVDKLQTEYAATQVKSLSQGSLILLGTWFTAEIGIAIATKPQAVIRAINATKNAATPGAAVAGKAGDSIVKSPLDELKESGAKYNLSQLKWVVRTKNGKIMWLEEGKTLAGLKHIIKRHGDDFLKKGIPENQIVPLLKNVLEKGKYVKDISNSIGPGAIYYYNGAYYGVGYGTNGFIVTFYPLSQK